jgi:uncharacterized protein YndB with AHSA1/START domain
MTVDRIEREILIAAARERVWSLVTRPGFWVHDEDASAVDFHEGALVVSEHPELGRYPVRVEKIEPQRYVSYRWASTFPGEEPTEGNSTLIEFTLTDEAGQTRLRVVESGFASLAASDEERTKSYEANTGGWAEVMNEFKRRAEEVARGR